MTPNEKAKFKVLVHRIFDDALDAATDAGHMIVSDGKTSALDIIEIITDEFRMQLKAIEHANKVSGPALRAAHKALQRDQVRMVAESDIDDNQDRIGRNDKIRPRSRR